MVLEGKKDKLIRANGKADEGGQRPSKQFEKAARLRDEIDALRKLETARRRGQGRAAARLPDRSEEGHGGLAQGSRLPKLPRTIEGVDIAHLGGEDTVASLVSFIDGLPFKPGYRRYKIKTVEGVDDFASMREVCRPAVPPAARRRASVSPTSC